MGISNALRTHKRSANILVKMLGLLACIAAVSCTDGAKVAQDSADGNQPPVAQEVLPAKFTDLSGGERTYYENCAACHITAGRVGPPLIYDVGYFMDAGVTPEQLGMLLFHPVRVKREGSIMPAFTPEELSDEQVMELGIWMANHFEPAAEPMQLGDATNGAELYATNCALCHGAAGEGNELIRPLAGLSNDLRAHEMPPTTILGFTHLASRSGSIKDMPTWTEEELSDSDLADIAAFIWEFPPLGPPPVADAE